MLRLAASAVLFLVGSLAVFVPEAPAAESRPNIVVVLMDDLRWDELGCTGQPFVQTPHIDRIAPRRGELQERVRHDAPLLAEPGLPILTGHYAHRHGVTDNTDHGELSHKLVTFPRLLHDAGYTTAFIGKWHMGVDDSPRPGIDHWVSVKGQGAYFDPELNVDGRRVQARGYVTDLFNQYAADFLRRPPKQPWLLYVSHKAVHPNLDQRADGSISDPLAAKFTPAPRHEKLYADQTPPRRPNTRDDLAGKPALTRKIGDNPPLGPTSGTDDETIRNRLRLLMGAEEGVGQILEILKQQGTLDNTLIVFTSDHGYFYGEHCLSYERRLAYEEAIRIPLLVRYPPRIKPGTAPAGMVLSIDLMPTLLELAGVTPPADGHGTSLMTILDGRAQSVRSSLLVEYFSDAVFPRVHKLGYDAVRTDGWKLIRYKELVGMDEMYDLAADPYELKNLISKPAMQERRAELMAELERLLQRSK